MAAREAASQNENARRPNTGGTHIINESSRGPRPASRRNFPHVRRRHYGCPLFRAPRTDDGRHAMAGLLARGSSAPIRLPVTRTVAMGSALAADSCGGSRRFDRPLQRASTALRSLFIRASRPGTIAPAIKAMALAKSQGHLSGVMDERTYVLLAGSRCLSAFEQPWR